MSAQNHFGSLGGVTFCIICTFFVNWLALSSGLGSELDSTIRQLKMCRVNSWSTGNWTLRNVSRHCSNHGSVTGISRVVLSAGKILKYIWLASGCRLRMELLGVPSMRTLVVRSHWANVTESANIFRANIVCGGRQPTSHTLMRMPLIELTVPEMSRK